MLLLPDPRRCQALHELGCLPCQALRGCRCPGAIPSHCLSHPVCASHAVQQARLFISSHSCTLVTVMGEAFAPEALHRLPDSLGDCICSTCAHSMCTRANSQCTYASDTLHQGLLHPWHNWQCRVSQCIPSLHAAVASGVGRTCSLQHGAVCSRCVCHEGRRDRPSWHTCRARSAGARQVGAAPCQRLLRGCCRPPAREARRPLLILSAPQCLHFAMGLRRSIL